MYIVHSYSIAIAMCVITMLCWGSWANTQKLASKSWPFQLFYWDYSIGILLFSFFIALTAGSTGDSGRGFLEDLAQGGISAFAYALAGGLVFNLANILLVAAIDIAGMAVAFPIGIGIALVEGVLMNYIAEPKGNAYIIFIGVTLISVAIIIDAIAYRRIPSTSQKPSKKGIVLSLIAGLLMGLFYYLVQASMVSDFSVPEAGRLTPYTAVFVFSVGIFVSNFLWNTIVMYKPFNGPAVSYADYLKQGTPRLHLIGLLGGVIWCTGMTFNILASEQAGDAIAYGLGQGATMIAALWGVFVWKEFKEAPKGTNVLLTWMFLSFVAGLALLILAKVI